MSKEQIESVIEKMRATQEEKDALQKACDHNDQHALFCVYGLMLRQKNENINSV